MRTLYLDCTLGISRDRLLGALLDLLPDPEAFITRFAARNLPGTLQAQRTASGVCVTLTGDPAYTHRDLAGVRAILENACLSDRAQADALAVYRLIAEAEAEVHQESIDTVHFHEVGRDQAVTGIAAIALLMEELAPERILSSPVQAGSGFVHCAHGVLPIPAPAAAILLREVPFFSTELQGELCPPTGAALLRHYVTGYGDHPVMPGERTGRGVSPDGRPPLIVYLGNQ